MEPCAGLGRVRDDAKLLCICRDREGRGSKRYAKQGVATLYISFYNEFEAFLAQTAHGPPPSQWESFPRAPAGQKSQRFGYDSVLCERSRGISCISLHRILFCICLDKSGLSIGPCHGHFLLPSWKNKCQVGSGTKSRKIKVLRMAFSIVENVPTPRESIFELFPASQRPYGAKNQKWTEKSDKIIY